MLTWDDFSALLTRYAKRDTVSRVDALFDDGLGLSSIAFTEFVMDLEEGHGLDIDIDSLDAGIVTAGQLFDRIAAG